MPALLPREDVRTQRVLLGSSRTRLELLLPERSISIKIAAAGENAGLMMIN